MTRSSRRRPRRSEHGDPDEYVSTPVHGTVHNSQGGGNPVSVSGRMSEQNAVSTQDESLFGHLKMQF